MVDRRTPNDDNIPYIPPAPSQVLNRTKLFEVADFLQENYRIGRISTRYSKYHRYTRVNLSDMFASLVNIYTPLFVAQWYHMKGFMEAFNPPAGVHPWVFATRVYISAWMHDLYVSNKEAAKKIFAFPFSQYYQHDETYYSCEYDEFLVKINASIRPTHIKGTMEDTLYIPLLHDNPNWDNETNPFGINHFHLNYDLVSCLIQSMKYRKAWNMSTLVNDTIGRPAWLFDWHETNKCCACFPMEGNYNMEDVSLAYIIGVACIPMLGPCDPDDWQDFPNRIVPNVINPNTFQRVVRRRFYGAYEVRTLDQRTDTRVIMDQQPVQQRTGVQTRSATVTPPRCSTTAGNEPEASEQGRGDSTTTQTNEVEHVPQFRIVDWTYYSLVVNQLDVYTRTGALKMLAFK